MKPKSQLLTMNDGLQIPNLGLGLYKVSDEEARDLITFAAESGYRLFDTAMLYGNEKGVGEGVRHCGLPRDEVFVTSKVWIDDLGFEKTLAAFEASRKLLGLDYLDLYLIHWPAPSRGNLFLESWRALEKLKSEGLIRSIGVSNFNPNHLQAIFDDGGSVPAVNQIELHPWFTQTEVAKFDAAHEIITQSWSPLARGAVTENPVLDGLAAKYEKTPGQIVLRWHIQNGFSAIPKSVTPDRIAANIDIFDFELSGSEMQQISDLNSGQRLGPDPEQMGA